MIVRGDSLPKSQTRKLLITHEEGGEWKVITVHSFVTPDGERWDAHNGWTGTYELLPEDVDERQKKMKKRGNGKRIANAGYLLPSKRTE